MQTRMIISCPSTVYFLDLLFTFARKLKFFRLKYFLIFKLRLPFDKHLYFFLYPEHRDFYFQKRCCKVYLKL